MTSTNETDRQVVRDALKQWQSPQTIMALLMLGYERDMLREELRALLELIQRIDQGLA